MHANCNCAPCCTLGRCTTFSASRVLATCALQTAKLSCKIRRSTGRAQIHVTLICDVCGACSVALAVLLDDTPHLLSVLRCFHALLVRSFRFLYELTARTTFNQITNNEKCLLEPNPKRNMQVLVRLSPYQPSSQASATRLPTCRVDTGCRCWHACVARVTAQLKHDAVVGNAPIAIRSVPFATPGCPCRIVRWYYAVTTFG